MGLGEDMDGYAADFADGKATLAELKAKVGDDIWKLNRCKCTTAQLLENGFTWRNVISDFNRRDRAQLAEAGFDLQALGREGIEKHKLEVRQNLVYDLKLEFDEIVELGYTLEEIKKCFSEGELCPEGGVHKIEHRGSGPRPDHTVCLKCGEMKRA